MFRNYLKIALRNLRRQPVYSAINIAGLGVGMACCLLILIFVKNEYGVNRFFKGSDSIYRINSIWHEQGDDIRVISFSPLAKTLETEFSSVEKGFRYTGIDVDLRVDDTPYRSSVLIAGAELFHVFSFDFLHGNPATALTNPSAVVLTDVEAEKLFGRTDVLGEVIYFSTWGGEGEKPYQVTGVIKRPPYNSITWIGQGENNLYLSFESASDFFANADFDGDWSIHNTLTYLLLKDGVDPTLVEQQFPALLSSNLPDALKDKVSLKLEPLKDVYLNDFGGGTRRLTRLLFFLAMLIMGIACFNYINVSTALAVSRAKEVGMRKVLGASRIQLVKQYLGESMIVCSLGMFMALVLANAGIGPFSDLVERVLSFQFTTAGFWAIVVGLVVVIGILGGIYPAFYLSAVQPAKSLKDLARTGKASNGIRRGLVVVQFTIAIGLFISAVVINRQATFIAEQDTGFDKEQVLAISSLPREWTTDGVQRLDVIKQVVKEVPGVQQVSVAWGPPGPRYTGISWDLVAQGTEANQAIPVSHVDAGFLETVGIELAAGDFFDPLQVSPGNVIVLNETAANLFEWEEPVGQFLMLDSTAFRVMGVVKDYHTTGLEHVIGPLALVDVRQISLYRELLVRLPGADTEAYLDVIEEAWAGIYPNIAFDYYFVDQQWYDLHKWIWRTRSIAGLATLFAILIACLGLFGVVSISVGQRTREIGIRKVVGASIPALLKLLSVDFFKLVGFAFVLSMPLSYFAMNTWLEGFANRIGISIDVFVGAALLVFVLAGTTVLLQAIRAALMNPVDSLYHE